MTSFQGFVLIFVFFFYFVLFYFWATCSANSCEEGCWVERHGHEAFCDTVGKNANEISCLNYATSQTDNGVPAKTTWCPAISDSGN